YRLVGATGAERGEQAPRLIRGIWPESTDGRATRSGIEVSKHDGYVRGCRSLRRCSECEQHVEEAMMLKAGIFRAMSDCMVQSRSAFECQPLLGERHQAPGQCLLVRECLGRDSSGSELGQITVLSGHL